MEIAKQMKMNRFQQSSFWVTHWTSAESRGGRSGQNHHLMIPEALRQLTAAHPEVLLSALRVRMSPESCLLSLILSYGCCAWIRLHFAHQTCLGTTVTRTNPNSESSPCIILYYYKFSFNKLFLNSSSSIFKP